MQMITTIMKKHTFIAITLFASLSGCGLTDVVNPNVTDEVYLSTPQSGKSWLNGMRRQLAMTYNEVVVSTELVSDNYFNNRTLSSKVFDIPQIDYTDLDVTNLQKEIHRLRQMADFGLTRVLPADPTLSASEKAEMQFLAGVASLLSGELFVALPATAQGAALKPVEHFNQAVSWFEQAVATTQDAAEKQAYQLLLARTYYQLGNRAKVVELTTPLLTNRTLLRPVRYDGVNGVANSIQFYVYSSTNNEFAPLPRLDFLDPKYYHIGSATTDQRTVVLTKAEEAYLMLAEAQLGNNQPEATRQTLLTLLIDVIANRPRVLIDDKRETRNGGNRADYPTTAVQVRFSPGSIAHEGLVLDRSKQNVSVYAVSGTSVTPEQVRGAATADDLLYLIALIRQEVFFAEGRRMTDLGIKFPVAQNEHLNNSAISTTDLKAQFPAFIPTNRTLDDFTFDRATGIVTIKVDMNQVLVRNKTAPEIFPLINP